MTRVGWSVTFGPTSGFGEGGRENPKEVKVPTIFFYGPDLEDEKKKELISSFTETASRLTGINKSAFTVYLRASSPDNVGVGGELLKERLERERR